MEVINKFATSVVKAPDPRLRIETKPVKKVTPALLKITREMIKVTKTFKDPEGVGLASTQVGLDGRFFVAQMDKEGHFSAFFNPEILSFSRDTKIRFEGCLSIPTQWGEVERALRVRVRYLDENGKSVIRSLRGVPAWIFQHEVDHLNGILFPIRVMEQKGKFYKWTGKDKVTGEDMFEEIVL